MRKLWAFLVKDILTTLSYRFYAVLQLAWPLVMLFLFFSMSEFIGENMRAKGQYPGGYFPFVLVGLAASSFVTVGLHAFAEEIRNAQVMGTLEALLATPTSVHLILLGSAFPSFIKSFLLAVLYILGGTYVFGATLHLESSPQALAILLLTFLAFCGVGMLSAGFVMVFKKGNPINMIFGTSSYILGGIFFPSENLPSGLREISQLLPITHSIRAMRELLINGRTVVDIIPHIRSLLIFTGIVFPVSLLFFAYAVRRAKRDGSLVQY
ncbi:MAG: ABC transporter permease [Planctomycetes bacterium]|nr:ABC transporter permease [Planctomycetota bacterium]